MTTSVEGQRQGWTATDSTFGARLALVRQRMGWGNVKEAATACGFPAENWRRWERDGVGPRHLITIAMTIARILIILSVLSTPIVLIILSMTT